MSPTLRRRCVARVAAIGVVLGGAVLGGGCATRVTPAPAATVAALTEFSPAPEIAESGDAWRQAEALAATIPESEVLIGSGDSMLPLYRDRTVLVVRRFPINELRAGMTVVFSGDQGHLVAHALVEKSPGGWIAQGLGNGERDRTRVRASNYLGTVIKAFAPTDRRTRLAEAERLAVAVEEGIWLARDGRLTRVEVGL
jgi:hypothetical protein